jgi:WD40 repeat protein
LISLTQTRRLAGVNQTLADANERKLYESDMEIARQALADGRIELAVRRLARHMPTSTSADLRGFEWYHLWRKCAEHANLPLLRNAGGEVLGIGGTPETIVLASRKDERHPRVIRWSLADAIDNKATFTDFATKGRVQHFSSFGVVSIACSPQVGLLAYFKYEPRTTLELADLNTGKVLDSLDISPFAPPRGAGWPGPIAFSPDVTMMASRHYHGAVMIWRINSQRKIEFVKRLQADTSAGWEIGFSPNGSQLAGISIEGTLRTWDIRTYQELLNIPHSKTVYCFCWTPDGTRLISGTEQDGVQIWDAATGTRLHHVQENLVVHALAVSPDGGYLAVGSKSGDVQLIDLSTLKTMATYTGHRSFVESLAFTRDGRWLVSGDELDDVRFWPLDRQNFEVRDATETKHDHHSLSRSSMSWLGHDSWMYQLVFHPNQNVLATCSQNGEAKLWSVHDGQLLHTFQSDGPAVDLAFSGDGKLLGISRWVDSEERLFDLDSHASVRSMGPVLQNFIPIRAGWRSISMARPQRSSSRNMPHGRRWVHSI